MANHSEAKLSTDVLKQDPNTQKVEKDADFNRPTQNTYIIHGVPLKSAFFLTVSVFGFGVPIKSAFCFNFSCVKCIKRN